jgi:hypothetical protein
MPSIVALVMLSAIILSISMLKIMPDAVMISDVLLKVVALLASLIPLNNLFMRPP